MVILGLDPGVARTGFGIVQYARRDSPEYAASGVLSTPAHLSLEDRLLMLGEDLTQLLVSHPVDAAVVEQIFFGTNAKTAFVTAQARGVLLYVLRQHKIPIEHATPLQIKSRLTGYGAADKQQVQQLVMQRLHLTEIPRPDDAADALACALCATQPVEQAL